MYLYTGNNNNPKRLSMGKECTGNSGGGREKGHASGWRKHLGKQYNYILIKYVLMKKRVLTTRHLSENPLGEKQTTDVIH